MRETEIACKEEERGFRVCQERGMETEVNEERRASKEGMNSEESGRGVGQRDKRDEGRREVRGVPGEVSTRPSVQVAGGSYLEHHPLRRVPPPRRLDGRFHPLSPEEK